MTSSLTGLAQPFLVRHAIDHALPHQDVTLLAWLVAGMVAVAVVGAAIGVTQTWLSTSVGQQVMHRLRTDLFAHLQRQSIDFFTRTRGGEVQSRLTHDISGMQSVVTSTATSIAANVTVVLGTAAAMVTLSWRLALLSLVVLPPAIWLTRQVATLRHRITAERQRRLADLHVQVEEGLSVSGVLLSKTLGASPP
ncbi:ABC transporter transmembrane domain-containing protein [Nocardioides alcanivorans]|uniref:ABC transporter transmembrane domain-containing protein n=1 Tax=Nocardioides alcanivorans TaxID=2897352 RepID=UPI001EFF17C7|nr:ABC transporter transmembrane domain-containing protein [Nocardioides alcanivorans]